mmetsp:Transcript_14157/g.34415  ORF Transcript_14157/g.34415 Transcript_14157/m.34415 type:complete len:345 (+) Transcript_14157:174-1208(+)
MSFLSTVELGLVQFGSLHDDFAFEVAIVAVAVFLYVVLGRRNNSVSQIKPVTLKAPGKPPKVIREKQTTLGSVVDVFRDIRRLTEAGQFGDVLTLYMEFLRSPAACDVHRYVGSISDIEGVFMDVAKSAHRLNRVDLCRRVASDMRRLRVPQTAAIFESVMKMLASKKCYDGAINLYSEMLRAGIQPTTDSTSCLINFLVQNGQVQDAVRLLQSSSSDVRPSIRTYTGLLKTLSSSGDAPLALEILQDMRTRGIRVDQLILNMVLSACSRCRGFQKAAADLLLEFRASHGLGDAISYRVVLKGLEASGHLDLARNLLLGLDTKAMSLDDRVYFQQVRQRLDALA